MKKLEVLLKAVTLLHRETMLSNVATDNSRDLVRTVLRLFDHGKESQLMGGESTVISDLTYLLKDMIDNPDNYDKVSLLQSLELILKDKENLLKVVDKTINTELRQADLKRTIISLRNVLNNYYKEESVKKLISKASFQLNTNAIGEKTISEFVNELSTNLEAHSMTTKVKDPGIIDEQDVGDEASLGNVIDRIKAQATEGGRLRTGWKELNEMTQNGFRRGTMCSVNALQHNYKSGFTQSLLMQLPRHNKPVLDEPGKKPLIVYISFEDDSTVYVEFMYRYLYYNENVKLPDMDAVDKIEMAKYIKEKVSVNGYHVKMVRVNPSEWTYKHLFNKMLEYEANGYEIHAMLIDYLSKLPTTGCIQGPAGTDLRDMFQRVRNFATSKNIFTLTPHQFSSDAKALVRNGLSSFGFLREVAGRGYTEGSKQLDQVLDMEINLIKTTVNRKWHLAVGRGKDRQPGILDDDKMFFMLPFPYKAPIIENINDNSDTSFSNGEEDTEFDF